MIAKEGFGDLGFCVECVQLDVVIELDAKNE
jgi:hypothetical protein